MIRAESEIEVVPPTWQDPQNMPQSVLELFACAYDNPDSVSSAFHLITAGWSYLDSAELFHELHQKLFSNFEHRQNFSRMVQALMNFKRKKHYDM